MIFLVGLTMLALQVDLLLTKEQRGGGRGVNQQQSVDVVDSPLTRYQLHSKHWRERECVREREQVRTRENK